MAEARTNSRFDLSQYLQTSKQKSYFVVVITVALVVLVVVAGILPAYSAIALQNRENEKRDEGISQLEKVITQYQNFIAEEEAESILLAQFNEAFPESSNQDSVINDINQFTDRTNVLLKAITFSSIQREVPLTREFEVRQSVQFQKVSVSVEGSRQSILNFIAQLETSRTIYNVVDITIARKQGIVGVDIIDGRDFDATIQAEFYWTDRSADN